MNSEKAISIRKATDVDFPEWLRMRNALWPEASYDELMQPTIVLNSGQFRFAITTLRF